MKKIIFSLLAVLTCAPFCIQAQNLSGIEISSLPVYPGEQKSADWLIDPSSYKSGIWRSPDSKDIILSNGLVRRTIRISPNAATTSLDNLFSNEVFLRAVRPEAVVELNGIRYDVGGLKGQPNHAFLDNEWIDNMTSDPASLRLTGIEIVPVKERLKWNRVRHHGPDATWPPSGIALRMDYEMPAEGLVETLSGTIQDSHVGRKLLLSDDLLLTPTEIWKIYATDADPRSSFSNEGKAGEIYTPANTVVYAETALPAGTRIVEALFDPGTDQARQYGNGIALIWPEKTIKLHLSPGGDGYNSSLSIAYHTGEKWVRRFEGVGYLDGSITYTLRIRLEEDTIYMDAKPEGESWRNLGTIKNPQPETDPIAVRIGKTDANGGSVDAESKGEMVRTSVRNFRAYGPYDVKEILAQDSNLKDIKVSVYYELYDGIPAMGKYITVTNHGTDTVTLNSFLNEILAAVEYTSRVEERGIYYPTPNIHVETEYAFGGFDIATSSLNSVRWERDPEYTTQVMWSSTTPCLLKAGPVVGPEQDIAPGGTFESFVTFIMPYDSYVRERNGLAMRKFYRTIAPWTTENPLMMHVRNADWTNVKNAIDQCAEVGFEMVIMTFGSGFNIEDDSEQYLGEMKRYAEYARSKGIELGGYSLLSSRNANPRSDNVVSPPGQSPTHGVMPSLASGWGQDYMRKLYEFYKKTGQNILEHDGSYPGDFDMTPRPPLQKGGDDSQWVQWRIISDFYKWCKEQGVFLNIPDFYFLVGGNKIGMGYREVNWSLPRAEQLIHTRQNIFDGTWEKTPTMGWMHVPLTVYHGGGAAATIEPLHEHLDHYRNIMAANLGAGVQAVYRGDRLYDTDETKAMVQQMIGWFKQHREVLESDIIHLKRADGHNLDYYLHANPSGKEKGLLMVFNPRKEKVSQQLEIPLYYTGLNGEVAVQSPDGVFTATTDATGTIKLEVTVSANSYTWFIFN